MNSIANTIVTSADAVAPTAARSAAGGAANGADFMALVAALLQGAAPAGDAPLPDAAPVGVATTGTDEDATEGEDADELLASLAVAQFLPVLPPPNPQPAPRQAAPLPAAASPQQRAVGATAGGAAAEAMVTLLQAEDPAQVLLDEDGSLSFALPASDDPASATANATPAPGLNAWAAAANRLAGGQDAYLRPTAAPAEGALREPVGTPRWKDELGTHLTLMAVQGQQSGSLRLSPEHLGPMEIQITVADDKTNVQFGAQNPETRSALQDAMPRLRELFAAAGLQLGDAGVSGQTPRQQAEAAARGFDGHGDGEPTPAAGPVRSITHSGLLDTYA